MTRRKLFKTALAGLAAVALPKVLVPAAVKAGPVLCKGPVDCTRVTVPMSFYSHSRRLTVPTNYRISAVEIRQPDRNVILENFS